MSRRIRDVVVAALALLALFAMLVSINPRLRERTEQVIAESDWNSLRGTAMHTIGSGMELVQGYAGDNSYLFTFLVAACVLVVLMLKVIS